ncbi:glyoxylate/hydroxypyruvate reductase B [Brucella endophytica]|uniref:Glyoxylate/hydroxypyruvate reductase B n=1 Tax=Brucella endophytica TaxID=1963359 RepID=A0A916WLF2_9HYPH|nr:NAD(P)-dependent oxidoreductase [Brucella endophytica]GGB11282.1 glyoxylate/hydroxypyruvate reductase B [Brucella endophytica]
MLVVNRVLLVTGCCLSEAQVTRYGASYSRIIELPQPTSPEAIFDAGRMATDYILGGPEYIDAVALERMPALERLVLLGTGVASFVDQSAAAARGLTVMNTPHMNVESVAEFALAMLIVNASNAIGSADQVRAGVGWPQGPWKTLREQKIGIFGLGHIGRALLQRLHALGVENVLYASRHRHTEMEREYGLIYVAHTELFQNCDSVSIHVSYNPVTHHIINRAILIAANRDLSILCFANPRVIDPDAARDALVLGQIRRLYIDGYYREWQANRGQVDDPEGLLALPGDRFWATSHLAAQTHNAIGRQLEQALELLSPARRLPK